MIQEKYFPGHFYSAIPNVSEDYNNTDLKFIDLNFNDENHLKVLDELVEYLTSYDDYFTIPPNDRKIFEYTIANSAFTWMDGRLLYYYIIKNKPKKIIEIGCGMSTLLIYNTKKIYNLDLEIICIEPYPNESVKKLSEEGHITLYPIKLENIDKSLFKSLSENDILFIDSSHVGKLDSDVLFYFTKIFPLLNKGVYIHIHDIFFPYDYPLDWIKEGRFWNEQYFLYIFLQYNSKFKIEFCNRYSEYKFKEILEKIQANTFERKFNITHEVYSGGSIWLKTYE